MSATKARPTKGQTLCLNISSRYCPDWGGWEIIREVVSNAIDAVGAEAKIQATRSRVTVSTSSVCDLGLLLIMGEGTKTSGGSTIGQFGEGLKVAALAATRAGLDFEIISGSQKVSFFLGSHLESEGVLHAKVIPCDHFEGLSVSFKAPADFPIDQIRGKIILGMPEGPSPKRFPQGGSVYVKGVYICPNYYGGDLDWNFNQLPTNRDRAMVSLGDLLSALATWMKSNLADSLPAFTEILNGDTFLKHGLDWGGGMQATNLRQRTAMKERFESLFGTKAVAVTEEGQSQVLTRKGWTPVKVTPEVYKYLGIIGLPIFESVLSKNDLWTPGEVECFLPVLKKLKEASSLLCGVPRHRILVGVNEDSAILGQADWEDNSIWLSETVLADGPTARAYQVYLHEVAHLISKAPDNTYRFEDALDTLLGQSMALLMDGRP